MIDFQKLIDDLPQPPYPDTDHEDVQALGVFLYAAPLGNGVHSGLRQMAPLLAQAVLNWQNGWIYDLQRGYWSPIEEAGPQGTSEIAPPQDPKFDALDDKQKAKALDAMQRFIDVQRRKGTADNE